MASGFFDNPPERCMQLSPLLKVSSCSDGLWPSGPYLHAGSYCQERQQSFLSGYFVRRYTELVKEKLGSDLLDTQLAYSIRFYCMGAVGMTQEWVLNDNITSAETVVQMMFNSMPENLRRILF